MDGDDRSGWPIALLRRRLRGYQADRFERRGGLGAGQPDHGRHHDHPRPVDRDCDGCALGHGGAAGRCLGRDLPHVGGIDLRPRPLDYRKAGLPDALPRGADGAADDVGDGRVESPDERHAQLQLERNGPRAVDRLDDDPGEDEPCPGLVSGVAADEPNLPNRVRSLADREAPLHSDGVGVAVIGHVAWIEPEASGFRGQAT